MKAKTARELYEFGLDLNFRLPYDRLPSDAKSRWEQIAIDRAVKLGQPFPVRSS